MTVGLNASQARAKSQQDMIIYDETDVIMRAVITATATGLYETNIDDGTVMTESTPTVLKIGTVFNPTVTPGATFIINGETATLGVTDTGLNGIVADINDAEIPGVVASKDSGYLVLTITLEAQTTWTYEIGSGTANTSLGFTAGVYTINDPESINYFAVWQGTQTDRAASQQMDQIIKHFSNLGYKIERLVNTNTGKTFVWHIFW
jgi:hypothetical protein